MKNTVPDHLSMPAESAIIGFITADALGVPFEFLPREMMDDDPATGMTGYGTYGQPAGTWSDDTSLMLCVMENIRKGGNPTDLANLFVRWAYEDHHTPHGEVFDIGITTRSALQRFAAGFPVHECGLSDENSAGNGSLMRSLPYAFMEDAEAGIQRMLQENLITHRTAVCQDSCVFYVSFARSLAEGLTPEAAFQRAGDRLRSHWATTEATDTTYRSAFDRLLGEGFRDLSRDEIKSTGYVIHTLEAVVWCFLNHDDYPSTVLAAVNLGNDTDTIGALAGGLAGIRYGLSGVPASWSSEIAAGDSVVSEINKWLRGDA
jgi:ADP-ribosylglycohydrolase